VILKPAPAAKERLRAASFFAAFFAFETTFENA
jgi:hypothetical protein